MLAQRHLTPVSRQQIVNTRLERVTLKDISNQMNIGYETVKYTWRQYNNAILRNMTSLEVADRARSL